MVFLAGPSGIPCAVQTTADTAVTIDGQPAKASDLRPQMGARVDYVDITARAVTATSTLSDGKPHRVDGTLANLSDDELVVHTSGNAGFDVKMKFDGGMKVVREELAAAALPHGGVGVGTWTTVAEFKDLTVTQGDRTLYQSDFTQGLNDWQLKSGQWKAVAGAIQQTSMDTDSQAFTGDASWTDYTYSLKARKISGLQGFLIPFHVQGNKYFRLSIGAYDNTRTFVESVTNANKGEVGQPSNFSVEQGRWYDFRIELRGVTIKCYADDKLIAEATDTPPANAIALDAAAVADLAPGQQLSATYVNGVVSQVTIKLGSEVGPAPAKTSAPQASVPANALP
jgi:hypothetical protein